MKTKRILILAAVLLLLLLVLVSCGRGREKTETAPTPTPTPTATPSPTPAPLELPEEDIITEKPVYTPKWLEAADTPELKEHSVEAAVDYVDPASGEVVVQKPLPPVEHHWQYDHDQDNHWRVCILCGETGSAEKHSFDASGHCTVCGSGCEHSFTTQITEPTCTEPGYTTYTCSRCGYHYDGDAVPAAGHDYHSSVETEAGCLTDGTERYTCAVCEDSFTKPIPAHGHEETVDPAVAATCRTEGKTEGSHCEVCGEVIVAQRAIPVAEHHYENGKCIWCGAAETQSVPVSVETPALPELPAWNGTQIELPAINLG